MGTLPQQRVQHRQARPGDPCGICIVRDRSVCAALPGDARGGLATMRRVETVRAGETLAWEGAESTVLAMLRGGVLKRSLMLADGREQVVGLALPGELVGRPFARVCDHSLTAIDEAVLCVFPRAAFERFVAATPALEHALLLKTLDDLARAHRDMVMLARLSAPQRVAAFLLDLAARSAPDARGRIAIPLGRQQIGDLLGLSIETVSRKLRDLERADLIALPGYRLFVLHDAVALARLAGVSAVAPEAC